jgi:5-methylcytosine-specific restriction endonuclease McrA
VYKRGPEVEPQGSKTRVRAEGACWWLKGAGPAGGTGRPPLKVRYAELPSNLDSLMPQPFPIEQRRAVWEAWGKRCFYCHEPLKWDDLQLDHVIPKSFTDRAEQKRLYKEADLPPDFDVEAIDNIVPCCSSCNRRKSALLFPAGQLAIFLAQTRQRVSAVAVLCDRFKREAETGLLQARIEVGIGLGVLDRADVGAMFSRVGDRSASVRLVSDAQFANGALVGNISPDDVDALRDLPVRLGADLPEGLRLTSRDSADVHRYVRTTREYSEAIAAGFIATTTFGMKMEAFFKSMRGILDAIAAARPPEYSFITAPYAGVADTALVPSGLLPYLGDDPESRRERDEEFPTLFDLISAEVVRVSDVGTTRLSIIDGGSKTVFTELLRADLDGDGIEDLLVSVNVRAIGGTLGFSLEPVALARRSADARFERTRVVTP